MSYFPVKHAIEISVKCDNAVRDISVKFDSFQIPMKFGIFACEIGWTLPMNIIMMKVIRDSSMLGLYLFILFA